MISRPAHTPSRDFFPFLTSVERTFPCQKKPFFADRIEPAGERDVNHVVLTGLVKSAYENVKSSFGTHGLIKVSFTSGLMFFVGDKVMKNSKENFPFAKEAYHQYVQNRDIITPRLVRKRDQKNLKESAHEQNRNVMGNLPVLATCSIANLALRDELDSEDSIFQSSVGSLLRIVAYKL